MHPKARFHSSTHPNRRLTKLVGLFACVMLLSLPLAPRSNAQEDPSLPSVDEQQQAAEGLMDQLDDIEGAVDLADLTLDPALGPPPWTSYVPGRDQSTIDAWNELSSRLADPKVQPPAIARFALPNTILAVEDIEGVNETGLNDTVATGQFISGLGTGPGDESTARIAGVLGGPVPPPPEPDCPSTEEDGAIPFANPTPLAPPDLTLVLCSGVIGDGEFGTTSGDVDFYALNALSAGTLITVDAGSFDPAAVFAVTTAVYTSDGTLIASLNDSDSLPSSVLSVIAPSNDVYYAAVAGIDTLPSDPFDPAAGTGVSYVGDYLFFAGTAPAPPPPCISEEPDSTILDANRVPFVPGQAGPCIGFIGDGDFGATTGDFDFFAIDVEPSSDIIVDIVATPDQPSSPTTIALYDSEGNLVATADDDGVDPQARIVFSADDPGTYYALVSSPGVLPTDPFDASSGTIAGPATSYVVFVLSFPRLGPPPPPPGPGPIPTPTPPIGPGPTPAPPPPGPGPIPTPTPPIGPGPTPAPPPPGPEPIPTPVPTPTIGPGPTPAPPLPVPPLPEPLPFDATPLERARVLIDAALATQGATNASYVSASFQELDGPCASIEDDGAVGLAKPVTVEMGASVECLGAIGDGPFGATSGDFDFYAIQAQSNDVIIADVDAAARGGLDSLVVLLNDAGVPVLGNDDFDGTDSRLEYEVPADGTYYVVVLASGTGPQDPFDSSSGRGAATTGPYALTLARVSVPAADVDVYLVDLDVGDVLGAGFTMTGTVTIADPTGQITMQSGGSAAIIYPLSSPLRHLGNVGADYVAEAAGVHAVVLANGPGRYEGELRVKRAGLTDAPGDDVQTIYLDFDGGQFNQAIFDPVAPNNSGPIRTLSPLRATLSRWSLTSADENAVIDAVIAEFTENLFTDLHTHGGNGHRDATGIGGELDLEVLNSRDHDDPWGQPNVSRIIIGGSIAEAGIPTVGISESIDPGNFATEETAIVLLDLLSDPAGSGSPTLNDFGLGDGVTKVDLVGRGVGIIAAHEAGHFIGNWHTASFNGVNSVMDEGGDLPTTIGIGPDRILGTGDDVDTDFVTDQFSLNEGFLGDENTRVRSAQALSTGQRNVDIDVEADLPDDGVYNLRNVATGRVLDADPNGNVDTSTSASSDDRWELINIGEDVFNLRNVDFGTYLDGDADDRVDQSRVALSDDRWQIIAATADSFYLYSLDRGKYLSTVGTDARLSAQQSTAQEWTFEPVETTEPGPYVGERIALRNVSTGRWLDTDSNGRVDQSVTQRADDVWRVRDAGDGYVYLVNDVTVRYLDSDGLNRVIDTSTSPGSDDRWEILEADGVVTLRNVDDGGYLFAQGRADRYRVLASSTQSNATEWTLRIIDNPA